MQEIRAAMVTDNTSVQTALEESAKKFKLYMGHCLRANLANLKVQQDRISEVMEEMKREGMGKRCVIYLDFKMKKLPKKLRVPYQDWFGKRGMTWHGTAVFYDQSEEEKEVEEEAKKKLQEVSAKCKGKRTCIKNVHVDGCKRSASDLKLLFIDTVVENTGAQDTMTTDNIMDTVCIRLKKEIPGLRKVVMVSDNAPKYVNLKLPLMSFYILKSHSLRMVQVLHPDAHQ